MKVGKIERRILAKLQEANAAIQVTSNDMTRQEADAHLVAARLLAKKGLVTVTRRIGRLRFPTRVTVHAELTAFGHEFVDCFQTPLRTGGRIRAARYREVTGKDMPHSKEGVHVPWLINPRLARNQRPASMASPTPA